MRREKTAKIYIRRELHQKIKIAAAREGVSMKRYIANLLEKYEKENL